MDIVEYQMIKKYYGDEKARRSGVPLINHIDEGITILKEIGASDAAIRAYCLHPMLQSDQAFLANKELDFIGVRTEVLLLTMEYRRTANSYLSHMDESSFVGFVCDDVEHMLVADKVQNFKDFMIYHRDTHERSDELYKYFRNWFKILGVDYDLQFSNFNFNKI